MKSWLIIRLGGVKVKICAFYWFQFRKLTSQVQWYYRLQRVGNSEFPLIPTTLCTKVKLGNVNPIFVIYFYHLTRQIRKIENQ